MDVETDHEGLVFLTGQAPFGEDGRTVTSADIQEFFADLNQKKRRHL